MPRQKKPSFVITLPLARDGALERRAADMCRVGQRLTNAVLQTALAQVDAMRADPCWTEARTLSKAERSAVYQELRSFYGVTDYDFQAAAIYHASAAGFSDRLGSHIIQKIGTKVHGAVNEWLVGKRGRPRFKGAKRPLKSLEGKNNLTVLRFDSESRELVLRAGERWPVALPNLKKDEWLASCLFDGDGDPIEPKYVRLLWRQVRGRRRWYAQLMMDGLAPIKASLAKRLAAPDACGGLDIGPSTIAWVTPGGGDVVTFCAELDDAAGHVRRLQRRLDRQRRANNPTKFDAEGRSKRSREPWVASARQRRTQDEIQAQHARQAGLRKTAHGRLANRMLGHARHWQHDDVSPKALQRRWGRSIGRRAPGEFMSTLKRKAERAGAAVLAIDIRSLKTSQYDHATDSFQKKPLSQRWHELGDGTGRVQRDVYSAFLACHANGSKHDPQALAHHWGELAPVLAQAGHYKPTDTTRAYPRALEPVQAHGRVKEKLQSASLARATPVGRQSGSCANSATAA